MLCVWSRDRRGLTNIESYRLRLILADTQVLRLTGQQEPLQSYLGQASNGNDNGNEIRNDDGAVGSSVWDGAVDK